MSAAEPSVTAPPRAIELVLRRPNLVLGAAVVLALLAVALLSLVWTPVEPPMRMRIAEKLRPPLAGGLLGTDHYGRDVASLLMIGARNSLRIAVLAVLLGLTAGVAAGAAAAALAGRLPDRLVMRIADVVFAFPPVVSAIMLAAILGQGGTTAIIAIGVFTAPVFARLTRGAALQIWARDYILAARAAGKGRLRITLEHVLPNIAGLMVVQASLQLALAILTEAGLSYLGIGLPPGSPSWGRMLFDAGTFLGQAPHLAIVPGLAIAIAVLGFNLLGDGLRDLLDPRLRRR